MDEDELYDIAEEEDSEDEIVYRTYRMDFKNKRIIGMVDGIEASAQAMFKALQTRRFAHLIYDDQYGCDVFSKIGNINLTPSYLDTDLPVMVEDAFLNDSMILGISDFVYDILDGDSLSIQFSVSTIFGDASFEGVINDG